MSIWFLISVTGMIALLAPYFWSLERRKLRAKYGRKKGNRIGDIYGRISGWGFFLLWIGIWFSPQPRFAIPVFQSILLVVPFIHFSFPLLHVILSVVLLIPAIVMAIRGVKELSLKVSETHRAERVST
jgi:hypothetical protein